MYVLFLKEIVNEKKGDGIISAIDLFMDVDVIKVKEEESVYISPI